MKSQRSILYYRYYDQGPSCKSIKKKYINWQMFLFEEIFFYEWTGLFNNAQSLLINYQKNINFPLKESALTHFKIFIAKFFEQIFAIKKKKNYVIWMRTTSFTSQENENRVISPARLARNECSSDKEKHICPVCLLVGNWVRSTLFSRSSRDTFCQIIVLESLYLSKMLIYDNLPRFIRPVATAVG